jgi:hypothetical protein
MCRDAGHATRKGSGMQLHLGSALWRAWACLIRGEQRPVAPWGDGYKAIVWETDCGPIPVVMDRNLDPWDANLVPDAHRPPFQPVPKVTP